MTKPKGLTRLLLVAAVLLLTAGAVWSHSSADFALNWSTIAGGAGDSQATDYRVEGTIGQPLAHSVSTGAGYRVEGGFWPPFAGVQAPPPSQQLFLPLVVR
jgi:hypothetical protein